MKITNIRRSLIVTADFAREDASLDIYSSMEGAKEVEDAFFNALTESLKSPASIPEHIKAATRAADQVAEQYGNTLSEFGFYDTEPREVIDNIMNGLSLVSGGY